MPIPDEMRATEESRRTALIEAAAEASDELMLKYLEGEEISDAEIETALHAGTRDGSVVPVFVGSALRNIGVRELIRMVARHVPSPAEVGRDDVRWENDRARSSRPFVAQVFKVTADPFVGRLTYFRVISGTLKAQGHVHNANRREDERIGNILGILGKEQVNVPQVGPGDIVAVAKLASTHPATPSSRTGRPPSSCRLSPSPSPASGGRRARVKGGPRQARPGAEPDRGGRALHAGRREEATSQTILTAMGDAHVDVIVERLKRKFGAAVKPDAAGPARDDPSARRRSTTASSARPVDTGSSATL